MLQSRPCAAWHRAVVSPSIVVILLYCAIGSLYTVATHREWLTGGRCTIAVLQPHVCTSYRHLMCHLQHDLQAHDDGFILVTCVLALVTRIPASMTRVIIIYSHSLQSAECHGTRGSTGALHTEGGGVWSGATGRAAAPEPSRAGRRDPELWATWWCVDAPVPFVLT
jgi:hypothetical protein